MNKPHPQILTIWRVTLTFLAVVPAFLASLFLRIGSVAWGLAVGGLVLLFLALYLVYLPILYKNTSYGILENNLVLTTGVFTSRVTAMPISRIQFVAVLRPFVARIFGLSTLIAVAQGGRITVQGLKAYDAERLANELGWPAGGGGAL